MKRSIKIVLIVGGSAAALLVAAIIVALFVNANAYKPQLEAAASQTVGMEVKAAGRMGLRFFPSFMLTMRDIHVRNRGAEVASADKIILKVALWPLLRKQLRIKSIEVQHPALLVEKKADGSINLAQGSASQEELSGLGLANIRIIDATLRYLDERSGTEIDADGCDLLIPKLELAEGKPADFLKDLELTAQLDCREIHNKSFVISDVKATAQAMHGRVTIKPATMQVFGAQGTGNLHADYSGAVAGYSVEYTLPQFQIAEFFKTLTTQPIATGRMDFSLQLKFQGTNTAAVTRTMTGQFSLQGKDLTLKGRDLDKEFSSFESSQQFNLVDMGALFFAGPVGLVVTKGYNFADLLSATEGSSNIPVLVSKWNIKQGIAHAQDVALTTKEHRLALNGQLDFNTEQFDALVIALIDAKGCAIVKQTVTGSFQKPVVEQPSALRALTGPVLKLLKMGRDIFPGGECEVFYMGSVAPPPPVTETP